MHGLLFGGISFYTLEGNISDHLWIFLWIKHNKTRSFSTSVVIVN